MLMTMFRCKKLLQCWVLKCDALLALDFLAIFHQPDHFFLSLQYYLTSTTTEKMASMPTLKNHQTLKSTGGAQNEPPVLQTTSTIATTTISTAPQSN